MKRLISAFIAALVAISASLFSLPAGAVGATTGEVDVIFLVDSSRSMIKSDPDLIRLEAIELFADLCTLGSTKIGFVLFGSEINYSQEPIPVNTEEDRAKLKETVKGLSELKGSTDIGRAVLYAADMLASDEYSGNGKFIVFLSDGKTVITKGTEGRTLEDSQTDLTSGIVAARNAGIPIYTVGLNANGDVDEAELNYISASTYADETYMTTSASDLAEILSDIYVRHTGAENSALESYVSDGGDKEITFPVPDSSVVEANLVIMHSGGLQDIKLYGADGVPVLFDGKAADISRGDIYSLVKIYYPKVGDWKVSLKTPKEAQVDVNCILTRDYDLRFSVLSDKAIGAGTKLKFRAVLTDPESNVITDENIINKLAGKVIIKDETSGETKEAVIEYKEGEYTGEATLGADSRFTVQASLYSDNIDIRSEIMTLEAGDESIIEPEGPLKLILICAGGGILLIVLIIIIIKKITSNIKMYSGRLVVTVNTGGMPLPPANYDFAKKCPGRRKVMLSSVMNTLFEKSEAADAIPKNITSGIAVTMAESGDIRISKVNGLEYSGGITLGKNVILSNANRLTLRYKDKTGSTNSVIIQYMRT
jgi:hypothetical protein